MKQERWPKQGCSTLFLGEDHFVEITGDRLAGEQRRKRTNTAVVEHWESGTIDKGIGITIQLPFSTACHAAWGRVVFSRTLPSGYDGYAVLDRTDFSDEVTCNDAGGDGNVLPGQSVCLPK
ncbi:MAG TPA: hypothetical protein VFV38_40250 [Ktedonobacteraceae bacterium]|nr:hypothetical protein [Ktedonobacteraceae bacterium]